MNNQVFAPKLTPEEVEIFSDTKPTRPYIELATMHNDSGNYEDIVTGFRRRAQQLGADAVIIKMANTHIVPGWLSNTQQQTAYATAIKYKDTITK